MKVVKVNLIVFKETIDFFYILINLVGAEKCELLARKCSEM